MICSVATEMHIFRLLNGLSTVSFAKKLKVSQATVSSWECETRSISEDTVRRWAEICLFENPDLYAMRHAADSAISSLFSVDIYQGFYTSAVLKELSNLLKLCPFLSAPPETELTKKSLLKKEGTNLLDCFYQLHNTEKESLISFITNGDQAVQETFHRIVYFILRSTTFTIFDIKKKRYLPEKKYSSLKSLLEELVPLVCNKVDNAKVLISISSTRAKVDFFHLCFMSMNYNESNSIPFNVELKGISKSVYPFTNLKKDTATIKFA